MTRFRPCIDLHAGQVKQIVGGTLTTTSSDLKTNYVSKQPASHFAQLYRDNALAGAHVIMLGPGNEGAAKHALAAWPRSLQVGGGITDKNAGQWIDWGAEKVGDVPLHFNFLIPYICHCLLLDLLLHNMPARALLRSSSRWSSHRISSRMRTSLWTA